MKNKLVSILICTYNAENTIRRTLNSILKQTYEEYEILVLDNNSKDNTLEILGEYSKKNKTVKVFFEGKNLGAYGGLNYLLNKAEGEYIAIQDHDDIWHPEKLNRQVEFLKSNKNYIGCGTTTLMYYGISKMGYLVDTKEGATNCVIHTSLLFRNGKKRYNESDIYLCDVDFMKRVLCDYENKLFIIGIPLTLHYLKENGGNYSDIWFSINIKNIKKYLDLIGSDLYHIFCLLFIILCKFLPGNFQLRLSKFLMSRVNGGKTFHELIKNKRIYEMINFINK